MKITKASGEYNRKKILKYLAVNISFTKTFFHGLFKTLIPTL